MSSRKHATYLSLLDDVTYRSRDIDAKELLFLLRQAKAIPQTLLPFKGVIHVIDYTQRKHVALSGPIKNMIGYSPEEVMESGLDFSVSIFHQKDFKIYNETIFRQVTEFLQTVPYEEHGNYLFTYGYRMRNSERKWLNLLQQGSYVTDAKTKMPLYGVAVVVDISQLKKDNSMIFSIDKKTSAESLFTANNILTQYYYPEPDESALSKREREILCWLAEGFSSKQIANKLFVSESTIVNHRKNMLKKSNTKNVAELIQYAIKKGVI